MKTTITMPKDHLEVFFDFASKHDVVKVSNQQVSPEDPNCVSFDLEHEDEATILMFIMLFAARMDEENTRHLTPPPFLPPNPHTPRGREREVKCPTYKRTHH